MAAISNEDLKVEILAILRTVDLTITSSKKVRLDLEQKLHCDLADRKKEIAAIIAQYVADNVKDEEEPPTTAANHSKGGGDSSASSDSDSGAGDTKTKSKGATKRSAASASSSSAAGAKKSKKSAAANSSSSEELEDVAPVRTGRKKAATTGKDGKGAATTTASKGTGKGNSFTRPFKLSPELASLMGEESLPRHEVVRKVWALIKERNLYDPKNKQFAICDADLMTVIGVKRFRTFGMLKYLKKHFVE